MSASSSLATGVSRTNSRSLRNTFVRTSCELSARTLLKITNVARCPRVRSTILYALFYMCHLLKTCHGIPAQQKGLWNCLSRTPCMLVRYCDILHARAAGGSSRDQVALFISLCLCQFTRRNLSPAPCDHFTVARECVKHCEDAAHGLDRTRIHVPGRVSCVELST